MKNSRVSVVIPCFNEAGTISENIKKIRSFLADNFAEFEIIAVNDGSRDNTADVLRAIQREVPIIVVDNPENRGKGRAVKDGVMRSRFETVMFLDADLAIPIEGVPEFIHELKNGFDLVIASRFVPGLRVIRPVLWYRRLMEHVFRLLRIMIIDTAAIHDTQCGFKVFSKKAAMEIFPRMTIERFAFDAEMIFVASRLGYKIKELPIVLQNPTQSSVRIIRDSLNMLGDLCRIRWNSIQGKYKR